MPVLVGRRPFLCFAVNFRFFVGVCSADHQLYANVVFGSLLHNADDLGFDGYNSIGT